MQNSGLKVHHFRGKIEILSIHTRSVGNFQLSARKLQLPNFLNVCPMPIPALALRHVGVQTKFRLRNEDICKLGTQERDASQLFPEMESAPHYFT